MRDNLLIFTGITTLNHSPDTMLEGAKGELEGVIILGYDKDGEEFFSSSYASGADCLWLMERFKKKLLEVPDSYEGG